MLGGKRHAPAILPSGKEAGTQCIETEWAPEPVWMGAENLAANGIRPPESPTRSESLQATRYPGPH